MIKKIEDIDLAFTGLVATGTIVLGQGIQPLPGILSDHGRQRQVVILGTALTCMTMLVGPIWLVHEGGHLSQNACWPSGRVPCPPRVPLPSGERNEVRGPAPQLLQDLLKQQVIHQLS